ncbi:MAG: NADH dehydrogenase ubiquinone Fe-S protein 4 [Rhizomicrobium sp.]
MRAIIVRQEPSVTQSGKAAAARWRLDFSAEAPKTTDPLMGWTGSSDTVTQVVLHFATLEEAKAYAGKRGLTYEVRDAAPVAPKHKAYADNFRSDRKIAWSH